jgi:hypothetical protein
MIEQTVSIHTNIFFATLKEFATFLMGYPTMPQHIKAVEAIRGVQFKQTHWYCTENGVVVFERTWYKAEDLLNWLQDPDHLLFPELCKQLGWKLVSTTRSC